jgi:hypothetical protein
VLASYTAVGEAIRAGEMSGLEDRFLHVVDFRLYMETRVSVF